MLKWLVLSDIPAQGREFSFNTHADWAKMLQKYGMECEIKENFTLALQVLPQSDGYLLSGHLHGVLSMPCERCLQPAELCVDRDFRVFEEIPAVSETPSESLLREISGHFELNIAHLMWEQFNLYLPTKVLCSEECEGLCPVCGRNLNEKTCSCTREHVDPRMAVFKKIKIQ
ncbi:MAG: YceD family protein [Thermodesulfobacteriota bacterium]